MFTPLVKTQDEHRVLACKDPIELCNERNLQVSGIKAQLVSRIWAYQKKTFQKPAPTSPIFFVHL